MMDVLYIDDEEALLDVCKAFLELSGDMTVETTTSVKGARTLMAEKRFDAIISDYQMPEMNGIDFLKILRSQGNGIPFVLFTGKGREEVVIEALNSGADFYLQKGGNPTAQFKELEYKVKEAVRRIRAESALKMNEARLSKAQAIGQIGSWEYTWNGASGMLWGSDESWRIFGMPRPSDGTIGWSKIAERIVGKERAVQALRDLIDRGPAYDMEYQVLPADNSPPRFVRSSAELLCDQDGTPSKIVGVIQDITVKRQVEARLNRLNKELMAIKECNKAMIRARTEQELVNDICRIVCEVAGYKVAWIGMAERDEQRSVRPVAWSGDIDDYLRDLRVSWTDDENGRGAMGTAIRTGRSVTMRNLETNPLMRPWRDKLLKLGFRSMVAIPIVDSSLAFGAMGIYTDDPEGFTPEEVELLEDMTADLAFGILGLRAKERQLRAETALRRSEERFRTLFEEAPIAISISPDFVRRECNRRFVKLFGYDDIEELRDKHILDLISPRERPHMRPVLDREHLGRLEEMTTFGLRKDGSEFPMHVLMTEVEISSRRAFLAFFTDMSDRFAMGSMLKESEEKYRTIIEQAPLAFALIDASGTIMEVNPRFCDMMRCSMEDVLGKRPQDLMLPDDRLRMEDQLPALHDRGSGSMQARLFRGDGTFVTVSVFAIELANGSTMVFIEDITERRDWERTLSEREEELRKSMQKFQAIFEGAAVGIVTADLEGRPVDFNDRFVQITGFSPQELMGMRTADHAHPEDASVVRSLYASLKASAIDHFEKDVRYVRKDGAVVWARLYCSMLVDPRGRPEKVLTIVDDVNDRRRMNDALRVSEEMHSKLVSTIPDIVIRTDMDGTIVLVNDPALELSGYARDEVLGHVLFSFIAEEDRDRSLYNAVRMLERKIGPQEYHLVMKDGEKLLFEANGDVLRDGDGEPTGLVFVCRDLTERRQMETRLKEADRRLSILDGITRHDTLNKLVALQGYIDLERLGNREAKRAERLDNMERNVRFLREQADATREYQGIGMGRPEWQSLRMVWFRAVRNADLGKVAVDAEVEDVEILADPLVYKVFHNLIDNSLKHGGKVDRIVVRTERSGGDLMIVYADNGNGIADKENLFKRGHGTNHGLGLFLSREILDITGMAMTENGEPGRGVRFQIVVPANCFRTV
jgi:PAS domain S-box-containing protein